MQFPAFFPKELSYCASAKGDEELFRLLLPKTSDLILFFEIATDDETWSEEHLECLQLIINWLTEQAFADRLSIEFCRAAVRAIRKHFHIISAIVPLNVHIQLSDAQMDVNSLLLGVASDFFRRTLLKECRDKNQNTLSFASVSKLIFMEFQQYICLGAIPDLWKKGKEEIIQVLRQAIAWDVNEVAEMCERALIKYITTENAFEMIFLAHAERWAHFKEGCINFLNQHYPNTPLFSSKVERLGCEFKKFSEEALDFFQQIKFLITDIACTGNLVVSSNFLEVINESRNLRLLDISGCSQFSDMLLELPKSLLELNLSQCGWLSSNTLKSFSTICPHLESLWLCSNIQLNFAAWGELMRFKELKKLDISRCHQVKNEDLEVVLKARSFLSELAMEECKRVDDIGFFTLSKSAPRLVVLNLARCSISDSALTEIAFRCRFLTILNVSRCEQLTEKGIAVALKQAASLKEIDLTHCRLAANFVNEMRTQYPRLLIKH